MHSKKLIIGVLLFIVLLLHFIPVYSKRGFIQQGSGECQANPGYLPHDWRLAWGQYSRFVFDKSRLTAEVPSMSCGVFIQLRLFVL